MTTTTSEEATSGGPSMMSMLFVGAAIVLGATLLSRVTVAPNPLVGKDAPDFTLDVVHNGEPGSKLALSAMSGHPVILDFWATWCGPCQVEAPILSRVAERYKDRGLLVVGVDTSDAPGKAGPFAAKKNLAYPIVFDEAGVADRYGIHNLPTLVVVDKTGKVRAVRTGITDESALDALVGDVL